MRKGWLVWSSVLGVVWIKMLCAEEIDGPVATETESIWYQEESCPYPELRKKFWPDKEDASDCRHAHENGSWGVWMPEDPVIFQPFIADPRQVTYSAGWRFNDQVLNRNVIDISFGDTFPIYQWWDVWPGHGTMRIDLEGGLWAVFAPLKETAPLINSDYYVGLVVTYALGPWSFRGRVYHISSHIGDEYLIMHQEFCRKNPSAESVDIFASYYITEDIRLYAGPGYVLHQDHTFRCSRFYAECGAELYLNEVAYIDLDDHLYGVPFYGMHFRFRKNFKHHVDSTYVLGYEWAKTSGLCHKFRVFLEYHDGYSVEGQFCKLPTNYLAIRASYGF